MGFNLSSENPREKKLPPGQKPIKRILRWGIDHPGITSANPHIKLETYTLTVDGEVEKPVTLSWAEFAALPSVVSVSDFHCVEGWSVLDCRWEGVRIREIERLVKPRDTAKAVTFECADTYTTSLFREELAGDDVILASKLNGEALEEGLRLSGAADCAKQIRLQKCAVGCAFEVHAGQGVGLLGAPRLQRHCRCMEKPAFQPINYKCAPPGI